MMQAESRRWGVQCTDISFYFGHWVNVVLVMRYVKIFVGF